MVDPVRDLWKEMNARGLQSSPASFGCMTVALVVIIELVDEALELPHSHADSEITRAFICHRDLHHCS